MLKLYCDHCRYTQDDLTIETLESWVDKGCPECGKVILTLEEFHSVKVVDSMRQVLHGLRDCEGEQQEYKVTQNGLEKLENPSES